MTLTISLDYNRPQSCTTIYWVVEDEDGFAYLSGKNDIDTKRSVFLNTEFASATMALSHADRILNIVDMTYNEFDGISGVEIQAIEQQTEHEPIVFQTPYQLSWWFKIGGAL